VRNRGKMHNPVTGSGGMLTGTVKEKGNLYKGNVNVADKIASLVSLTLTPLFIEEIISLKKDNPQIVIKGYAILFHSSPLAILPEDISIPVALAALDVCGAPALSQMYSKSAKEILILGAGKSGILAAFAALESSNKITLFEKSK